MFRILKNELNRFFQFDQIGGIFTGDFFRQLPDGESEEEKEEEDTLFFFAKEEKRPGKSTEQHFLR